MSGRLAAAAAAMLISVVAIAKPIRNFAVIDRCLADGGAWNYRANRCEPAPSGPVDRIFVDKSDHWMAVYRDGQIVREFRVALGRKASTRSARTTLPARTIFRSGSAIRRPNRLQPPRHAAPRQVATS